MKRNIFVTIIALTFPSMTFANSAFESVDDGWTFTAGAYLITQNTEAIASVNSPLPGEESAAIPLSLDFSDIWKNKTSLGTLFFRYGNGTWGVETDYASVSLAVNPGLSPGPGPLSLDKVALSIDELELYGTYRIQNSVLPIELLAGVRYIKHKISVDVSMSEQQLVTNFGDDWLDPIIGVRVLDKVGDTNWFYASRVDIGGFGIGSDFSWRVDVGGGYAWDNGWLLSAKYKRLDIDYDNGSTTDLYAFDGYEHGLVLGIAYTF